MALLRTLSPRPGVVVGVDDASGGRLGVPGPWGLSRVVSALPLLDGPCELSPRQVVHDGDMGYLGDPESNVIGVPGVRVPRMVSAGTVSDTRRLR